MHQAEAGGCAELSITDGNLAVQELTVFYLNLIVKGVILMSDSIVQLVTCI